MVKVIVIGLDGATWDVIKPWVKEGSLPTFKRLMERGSWGTLKSTIPPISPPAWTSIATGKNPGKHGIFDFVRINRDYSKRAYLSTDKRSAEIWDFIEGSIVAHFPLTYPPKKINGIMISGMLTPGMKANFTQPKELKEEILRKFPDYQIELNWQDYFGRVEQLIKDIYGQLKEKINLFWYLFHKEWNSLFFVFPEIDRIQHILFGERKLLDYYCLLDVFLHEVLNEIEDKNVILILVSDHGFEKTYKTVHINTYFKKEGLLRIKILNNLIQKLYEAKENYIAAFFYFNFKKIKREVLSGFPHLPKNFLMKFRMIKLQHSKFEKGSKAFMDGFGRIYINHKTRFAKGHVDDAACAKLKEEIIEKLEGLKDPETGRKPIKRVYKAEEIYSGPFLDDGPALVALMAPGYTPSSTIGGKVIKRQKLRKGDHNLNGIFLAYGPVIKDHVKINACVYDVAPTILHIFGIPIPIDMDGKVLKVIFKDDSQIAKREIRYKEINEKEEISRRIRKLKKSGKL